MLQLCAYLQLPDASKPDAFLAPLINDMPAICALLQVRDPFPCPQPYCSQAADALECTDLMDLLGDTIIGLAIAQKTVAQCLAAFGLPADTVFTPGGHDVTKHCVNIYRSSPVGLSTPPPDLFYADEVAAAAADFPFLDMRHVPVSST